MTKILYVDTDTKLASLFLGYLREYGFEAVHSGVSSQTLKTLQASAFDLLICDLWCEPVSARTLCETVRNSEQPHLRDLSILVIGPEEMQPMEFKWIYKYNSYFMIKYKSPEEWHQKISTILNNRSLS